MNTTIDHTLLSKAITDILSALDAIEVSYKLSDLAEVEHVVAELLIEAYRRGARVALEHAAADLADLLISIDRTEAEFATCVVPWIDVE